MGLLDKIKRNRYLSPEDRRKKSIDMMKKKNIAYNEHLPLLRSSEQVTLKTVDDVKKRAMACFLSIQLACSINNGEDYNESLTFILELAKKWGLRQDDFLAKEKKLFTQRSTSQDVVDIAWSYECYWVLLWALDLITDKEVMKVEEICNCERAMAIAGVIDGLDLKLRNTDKILDMLDLFYCYHWACVEKRIDPDTKLGEIDHEVVAERRRALEWLIIDEKDWNIISLDT